MNKFINDEDYGIEVGSGAGFSKVALISEPYKGLYPTRSKSSEYSVMSGVCTHLGCAPKYFPEVEPKPWDATWNGGFFCPCHGSMFDIVGRVFKGVPAPTNLIVPPHMFEGSILTIGEDKEL